MSRNFVDVARSMGATITAHRDETEASRRLARPVVDRLAQEGLCRMFLDERAGGVGATPLEALRVYETLAGFEASVPWIAWNNALVCCFARYLTEEVRAELFAEPAWLVAQSTRPTGTAVAAEGGYRVSGRWSLVSGCELAEWLMLHCGIDGGATRFVVVHKKDFEIRDTWNSGGMRGTGSHDVIVNEAFVPARETFSASDVAPRSDDPISRVPIMAHMTAAFSAQAIGVASRCVEYIVRRAESEGGVGGSPAFRERTDVQELIPHHLTSLQSARALLHARISESWERSTSGSPASPKELAQIYAASAHANGAARTAVNAMYAVGGTRAVYADCPLERAHRDLHVMLRHVVAQPAVLADAGKAWLGLRPANPLYAV